MDSRLIADNKLFAGLDARRIAQAARAADPRTFGAGERLWGQGDPAEGVLVTANNDLNSLGQCRPINLPMGAYRAERIEQRLKAAGPLTAEDMQALHFDLYSLQAERLLAVLRPLLPETENGNTLRDWDCTYDAGSRGAMLFESVYENLLKAVFGDLGLGRETVDHLMKETGIFNDYYANFDAILLRDRSAWFEGLGKRPWPRAASPPA